MSDRGRVVVVGSVNVDLVVTLDTLPRPGETVSGGTFARHGGGKSANQAVAAARLGAAVSFVGAVGRDDFGDSALEELAGEGVDVAAVARVDAPTGVALIAVDRAGENAIAVASGANAALAPEGVARALDGLLSGDPGVVLLGHEVSDAVVLAAAQAASAAGWTVVLNPAPARPLSPALLDLGPLLTPNASEACALSGSGEPAAAARALAAMTHAPVLVTVGAEGALLCADGEVERIPAPAVEAVDTTGAGDTFNGALAAELAAAGGAGDAHADPAPGAGLCEAAALASRARLRDAAALAVAAAARSTTRPGARGGMPRREDLAS